MNQLKFETLRHANEARLPLFKNAHGEPAHSKADGSDWTPLEWAGACAGEAGELANICKKLRRGDLTVDEARPLAAKEIADVICYIDIVAKQLGIDVGEAVIDKFNEVSDRVGAPVYLVPIDHFAGQGEDSWAVQTDVTDDDIAALSREMIDEVTP